MRGTRSHFQIIAAFCLIGSAACFAWADMTPGEALRTDPNGGTYDSGSGLLSHSDSAPTGQVSISSDPMVSPIRPTPERPGQLRPLGVSDDGIVPGHITVPAHSPDGKRRSFLYKGDGTLVDSNRKPGMLQSLMVLPAPEMIGLCLGGGATAYLLRRNRIA